MLKLPELIQSFLLCNQFSVQAVNLIPKLTSKKSLVNNGITQWLGSSFWPNSDPVLCTSKEGNFLEFF